MSDLDLVTEGVVRDWATGTLEEWFPGYTSPTDDLPQFRIRRHGDDVYSVREVMGTLLTRRFKVTIDVEELL